MLVAATRPGTARDLLSKSRAVPGRTIFEQIEASIPGGKA